MSKIIETGSDSRAKLLSGVEQLANAVVTTLGPNGRNVVIAQQGGNLPQSTKDGVTVAKTVTLKDPVENLGAQMVKQASIKTADNAGDGTTTATLLAKELITEGMNHLSQKHNAVAIKRGMDKTAKEIVKHLKEMSTDISSEEQIKQVATISANNDEEVGNLIAAAIDKVGLDGVVTVEESKSYETTLETVEGMQFDRGYKSPYFVTDNSTMQAQLDGSEEAITSRLEEVKDQIERAESNYAVEQLQNRLAKMAGGVAVINVGGFTETEMKERKDRVDDALHATRAALDEGIVPGGGVALLRAKHMLCEANQLTCEGDETIGSTILLSAIEKPFIQILLNAGILKYHNILSAVEGSFSNLDKENYGYNIKTGEYIDMVEEGIIDPTKVTRTALENAVSVAGTMLITECTIVDDPEDDKEADPMSMMGM